MGVWFFSIAFDESRTMAPGGVDVFVLISGDVRAVPEVDVDGAVSYHSSCGDGPKPASESKRYRTRTPARARAAIDEHFARRGYRVDNEGRAAFVRDEGGGAVVAVDVHVDEGGGVDVTRYP